MINDSSNSYVMELLESELSKVTDPNIIENYHPGWSHTSANLFNILNNRNNRYKKGMYYVLEDNGKLVCSAGWNEYEMNPEIALALTRAYVAPDYRMQYSMAEYILPKIIDETRKYKHLYFTVNSYNKALYEFFVRAEQGKATGAFSKWPDIYKKFKPIGKKMIYNVEQYVAEYQEN